MPTTLQAIAAIVIALLPGALALWWFERHSAAWGIGLPDRFLRFIGVSAVFHAVFAPLTYTIWRRYLESGDWRADDRLPWELWVAGVVYVGVPIVLGALAGWASRKHSRWVKVIFGPAPAPRAWDALFFDRPDGWMRLKLRSGAWIGGAFSENSYASGYPEPGDLYLATAAEIDSASGAFEFDEHDRVVVRESGILVRWEEVEYLEFIDG